MQRLKFMLVCLLVLVFPACSEDPEPMVPETEPAISETAADEIVLARVNGSAITREDLDLSIEKLFDRNTARELDSEDREKILESLIISRAVAQKAESEFSRRELAEFDRKVRFYREELLAQKYIRDRYAPEPVTEEMIRAYYEAHPMDFGAGRLRNYELLSATRAFSGDERDRVLNAMSAAKGQRDWEQWARQLQENGHPLVYRQGVVTEKLDKRLLGLIDALSDQETSPATFIDGTLYVARVTQEKQTPPRPLDEVRSRIREMLAPLQAKAAIRKVGEDVRASAEVVYSPE